MHIAVRCIDCRRDPSIDEAQAVRNFPIGETGLFEYTCDHGHTTVSRLCLPKFDVLSEVGAHAIRDGYYQAAVSAFHSAMERSFVFAIRVISEGLGTSQTLYSELLTSPVRLSERRFGAYVILYATVFGEVPKTLSGRNVSFRNRVVHNGYMPNEAEAVAFAHSVCGVVTSATFALKHKYRDAFKKCIAADIAEGHDPRARHGINFSSTFGTFRATASADEELRCAISHIQQVLDGSFRLQQG